jgi:hypothetical protein
MSYIFGVKYFQSSFSQTFMPGCLSLIRLPFYFPVSSCFPKSNIDSIARLHHNFRLGDELVICVVSFKFAEVLEQSHQRVRHLGQSIKFVSLRSTEVSELIRTPIVGQYRSVGHR